MAMIATMKSDAEKNTKTATDALHNRVNRIRDEFVRRDDLATHLAQFDKRLDEMRDELRRSAEKTDKRLDAILQQLTTG